MILIANCILNSEIKILKKKTYQRLNTIEKVIVTYKLKNIWKCITLLK